MFNVNTCRWVIWGAKHPDPYNSFQHIFEAFERALKYLGKDVLWLGSSDDTNQMDFDNTCFLSMNTVIFGLPIHDGAFYVIHNILGTSELNYFTGSKLLPFGIHISTNRYSAGTEEIGPEIFFDKQQRSLSMRWGTDLLPHEIEANKPTEAFNSDSRVFNYVGSVDESKRSAIWDFSRACRENGIQYHQYGGYSNGPLVSIEKHIELIRDSYLAPAFQEQGQDDQGYIACRLFKNISYGQYGLTRSKYANELFGGKLIYNPDAYQLFYQAKERLLSMPVKELHDLMDIVARDFTYVNKVNGIIEAIKRLDG